MKQDVRDQPIEYRDDAYPLWLVVLGWAVAITLIVGGAWLALELMV